jgi:hypothetical protein
MTVVWNLLGLQTYVLDTMQFSFYRNTTKGMVNMNKTGSARINVTVSRVSETVVTVEK